MTSVYTEHRGNLASLNLSIKVCGNRIDACSNYMAGVARAFGSRAGNMCRIQQEENQKGLFE